MQAECLPRLGHAQQCPGEAPSDCVPDAAPLVNRLGQARWSPEQSPGERELAAAPLVRWLRAARSSEVEVSSGCGPSVAPLLCIHDGIKCGFGHAVLCRDDTAERSISWMAEAERHKALVGQLRPAQEPSACPNTLGIA